MVAFFTGLVIAVVLTIGAIVAYSAGEVTVAQRSSPQASVRLDDQASQTAQGAGYGNAEERVSSR